MAQVHSPSLTSGPSIGKTELGKAGNVAQSFFVRTLRQFLSYNDKRVANCIISVYLMIKKLLQRVASRRSAARCKVSVCLARQNNLSLLGPFGGSMAPRRKS